ncbi:UMP kinase [Patescibacteria group bacterium]|jgi:uridylate kinase|nr:UMP kinase [Patescibacteria group bacterium]
MTDMTVLLKFSGEALAGPEHKFPIDYVVLRTMCQEVVDAIIEAPANGKTLRVGIMPGGGNIMRGKVAKEHGIDPVAADHMGMMATVINAIAIQNIFEQILKESGTRVLSAIEIRPVAELYIQRRAVRHLEKGRIVIFGAGSGNPFFTTDTAAALRAKEIGASLLLKATDADGIFDSDPRKNPQAKPLKHVTYERCVQEKLNVMDMTAFTLCEENEIPIRVFSMKEPGRIKRALLGEDVGSLVSKAAA